MQESWGKWQPISGLEKYHNIYDIEYLAQGFFKILLIGHAEGKCVAVIFENGVSAHRYTYESLRTLRMPESSGAWTFFKVSKSSYIKLLFEKSNNETDYLSLMHFVFAGADTIIDVVATYEPIVEFIDWENRYKRWIKGDE
jgi:hypothetical protein